MKWMESGFWRKSWRLFDGEGALLCAIYESTHSHGWTIDCTFYGRDRLKDMGIDIGRVFIDAEAARAYVNRKLKL